MGWLSSPLVKITCLFIIVLGVMAAISVVLYVFGPGVWSAVAVVVAGLVVIIVYIFIIRARKKRNAEDEDSEDDDFDQLSGLPLRFTYEQLKISTNNFEKKLGHGSFGSVFEGTQENGTKIAVKRLESTGQGKKEFLAEVTTVGSIHHLNLVRLVGFCAEKSHRLLVYELMCNGSLEKWIFSNGQKPLDWVTRKEIIISVAKGLAYLHEECRRRIIHLDIKPQNILLDENLQAKISDFGMSTLVERDESQVVTAIRGTFGYMAPELLSLIITQKADVYSFGIVVMEIICGRKNIDRTLSEESVFLLLMLMRKAKEGQLSDMIDKICEDMQLHRSEVVEVLKVAVWCLQNDYTKRPIMSNVVKVLEGSMEVEEDLDYSIHYPATSASVKRVEEDVEIGFASTTPLLPWNLSGPR